MTTNIMNKKWNPSRVRYCRLVWFAIVSASILSMAGCNTYGNYMRRSSLSNYDDNGIDAEYGFDRLAVMRIQIQDQTNSFSGAIVCLRAVATGTNGQGGLPMVSGDALDFFQAESDWSSGSFDGVAKVEAKVDSISVNALRLSQLGRGVGERAMTVDQINELVLPLGDIFALQRGCLNYLGRLHVVVQKVGTPRPIFAQPSMGWIVKETAGVQYALWLEQSDKAMQEDIELISIRNPKLRNEFTRSVHSIPEVKR